MSDGQTDWSEMSETFLTVVRAGVRLAEGSAPDVQGGSPHGLSEIDERLILQRGAMLRDGAATLHHPLSGERRELGALDVRVVDLDREAATLCEIYDEPQERFLALWRLLPSRLHAQNPAFAALPADPALPDHSIWQAADLAAAGSAAWRDAQGAALLSVTIGPVQSFIEAARSVRDLWSGSATLSWLLFEALRPPLEALGPQTIIFPALRDAPLLDLWLRKRGLTAVPEPEQRARLAPTLPNRFLALVPSGEGGTAAQAMGRACLEAFDQAW
ncbi:MAG: type III-B CRISPR-associated protein Cas10/Cmr2 [Gammaproteobacteria bacterium]